MLNSTGVRYLLVGGYAVGLYGHPRATGDLDLWVAADRENSAKLRRCLVEFGFSEASLPAQLFTATQTVLRIGVPPLRVELLSRLSGVDFDACFARRVNLEMDDIPVHTITLADLIVNKRAAQRPKDLADLAELEPPTPGATPA